MCIRDRDGPVLWNVLFPDDRKLYAGGEHDELKGSLYQAEAAVILSLIHI